jgi:hypothetical protein
MSRPSLGFVFPFVDPPYWQRRGWSFIYIQNGVYLLHLTPPEVTFPPSQGFRIMHIHLVYYKQKLGGTCDTASEQTTQKTPLPRVLSPLRAGRCIAQVLLPVTNMLHNNDHCFIVSRSLPSSGSICHNTILQPGTCRGSIVRISLCIEVLAYRIYI